MNTELFRSFSSRPPCDCGSTLRPIGTAFDWVYLPGLDRPGGGSDTRAVLHRMRVTGHSKTICSTHYAPTRAETTETIGIKRKERKGIPVVNGYLMLNWQLSVDMGFESMPTFDDVPWE